MTDLRRHMHETYEAVHHVDLDDLVAHAQAEGGRLRRRHRRLAVAGSAAAVLAAVAVGAQSAELLHDNGRARQVTASNGPGDAEPRSALEALVAALGRGAPGGTTSRDIDLTDFGVEDVDQGQALWFAAAGGSPSGPIVVSYDQATERSAEKVGGCWLRVECEVRQLPDGVILKTWKTPHDYLGYPRHADLHARLLVNGNVVRADVLDILEEAGPAALTLGQLQESMSQPVWGRLIPAATPAARPEGR